MDLGASKYKIVQSIKTLEGEYKYIITYTSNIIILKGWMYLVKSH